MKTILIDIWWEADFRVKVNRLNVAAKPNRRSIVRPSILSTQHREPCETWANLPIRRRRWSATTSHARNTDGLLLASHGLS